MHWTEWAMIIMLIIFAIPVLVLLGIIGMMVFSLVYEKFRKKAKPESIQTPFGDFVILLAVDFSKIVYHQCR